jgi:hypothetical protein
MTNLVSKLRLDSLTGNSKNIWLCLLLIFILIFLNFQKLIIPEWSLQTLVLFIWTFQLVSLGAYVYWILKQLAIFAKDEKINKALYLVVLILATLLTSDLVRRVVFHDGY